MKLDKSVGKSQKFQIKIKRDFGSGKGFLINRKWVKTGFVVCRNGCNIMPGAVWFQTVEEAMKAITAYMLCDTSEEFWAVLKGN